MQQDQDQTYFAAADREQIGLRILDKLKDYGRGGAASFILNMQALAWQYLHGFDANGFMHAATVGRSGSMGESTEIRVNHIGALDNAVVSLVNQQKHTFEPRSSSNTSESLRAVDTARDALDYYVSAQGMLACIDTQTGHANGYGEGFTHLFWDDKSGADSIPIPSPTGQVSVVPTGDIKAENVLPWNVFRDVQKLAFKDLDYLTLALRRNKWDLVARYPESRAKILAAPNFSRPDNTQLPGAYFVNDTAPSSAIGDDIDVFRFYHRKCAVLPGGRDVTMLADGTVLAYSDLPIDEIPVARVSAGEFTGAPFGKTRLWDGIGMQQISDMIHSSISGNLATFARQNITYEEGTDPRPIQTPGGYNLIPVKRGGQAPQALQLTKSPEEAYRYLDVLKAAEEAVVGVNATSRGESPGERASGSLAVFLDAKTLQQASSLQTERVNAVMKVGTYILKFLNKYAKHPMKINVASRDGGAIRSQEITSESLGGIEYVYVSVGNPLTQSAAARIEVANILLQQQADHDTVERVLTTGQLKPILQGSAAQRILIRQENERMAKGEPVPSAEISDDHVMHMREHAQVKASLEARVTPAIMQAEIEHEKSHYYAMFGTDPNVDLVTVPLIWHANMLVLSGQQPPPMRPDLMPQPPSQTPPPAEGGAPTQTPIPTPGSTPSQSMPKQPQQPKNPATGARADGATPTLN